MKFLIIGAKGQLGSEVCHRCKERGFDAAALDLPEFDITSFSLVRKEVMRPGVSLVINAAAYTAVDQAESEPAMAFAVNRDGPAHLAASCAEAGIPLIHTSTDYVFDGSKRGPYLETDSVSPLGVYGRSKSAGEEEVRKGLHEHIILRTAWLYGLHGNNFVKTMLRLGKEKEVIGVVSDQYGCPTNAADLADAILIIAKNLLEGTRNAWGTYHFCGKGETSWHGFAQKIFDLARGYDSLAVKKVEPIPTSEYPTPAKRPANSVLDCLLIAQNFGINPAPWPESLARFVRKVFEDKVD